MIPRECEKCIHCRVCAYNMPKRKPHCDFYDEERQQGEWEAVGFVNMKYAWCRCSKCHKTTKIYLDSSNEFCCISDIRKKAVACLYCGADMRKERKNEKDTYII